MVRPLITIILLCLLVLSCNARRYGMSNKDSISQLHKVVEIFEEKFEELKAAVESHGSITSIIDHRGALSQQRPRRPRRTVISKGMKQKREAISVVAKKSVVSWRVPSKNHDQHPGIYSDYPKPRSRPPIHN